MIFKLPPFLKLTYRRYVGCGGGVDAAMGTLRDHPWFSRTMDARPGEDGSDSKGSAVLIFLPVLSSEFGTYKTVTARFWI